MPRDDRVRLAALLAVASLSGCARPPADDPRMISEWMHTLYGVIRTERISPPVASRTMAYAAVALHEGLAAAGAGLESAAGKLQGLRPLPRAEAGAGVDGSSVALAAEEVVLDSLFDEALPGTRATLEGLVDSLRRVRAAQGIDSATMARSGELGRRIGLGIVAWSRADGFDSTRGRPFTPKADLEYWINDSPGSNYAAQNISGATEFVALNNPANNARGGGASDRGLIVNRPKRAGLTELPPVNMAGATEPYWWWIRPFVLSRWDECPIDPPPPYSTDTASVRYREARQVYDIKASLTPEQTAIAYYWADNAGETGTPSGHWLAIASQMVSQQHRSAAQAARIFMLMAAAQADAFIASWGFKYEYNTIRPRTYIRRLIDSTWEPLIATPPFPEYPSGHSTQSRAAAVTIIAELGDLAFEDSSGLAIGTGVGTFPSFSAAALEAGMSRIYGGIHFESGNVWGRNLGDCIGEKTVERIPPGESR